MPGMFSRFESQSDRRCHNGDWKDPTMKYDKIDEDLPG